MALQRLEVCRKLHIITVVYYLSSAHKLASQYQPQEHSSTVFLHSCSRIKMADSWYQQSTKISSLLDIRKTSKEVQSSLGM